MTDQEFLDGIEEMIAQAPEVGLCSMPFKIIRDYVAELVTERNQLREYHEPQKVKHYQYYAGQCPRCKAVFLDDSTGYCGNCGQKLDWNSKE